MSGKSKDIFRLPSIESKERVRRFLNNIHQKASGLKSSFDSLLVTEVGTTSLGVGFCV
jgi:hypothetical protein